MTGLVLEGGTFRPIFSSGVMDALLDHNVHFPYVIGVSAGITDGVSYVSRQHGRNLDMLAQYRNDKRYVGLGNFLTDKSLFGLKFVFEEFPQKLFPFDWDTYRNSGTKVLVGVTNALTGKIEYLDGKDLDDCSTMLKATCAQPFLFPEIRVNDVPYYDGGITDSIPAKKAMDDGVEKVLIVLTRPLGYQKKQSKKMEIAAKAMKKRYPALVEPLRDRYKMYNEQLKYCEELERQGKAMILRPSEEFQIASLESDVEKIKRLYKYGYDLATENMDEIKEFFGF